MISDVPQHYDVDLPASVSNETTGGLSEDGARHSVQTVSHSTSEVALKASVPPLFVSSESDKTPMEFKLHDSVSSPHFAVPEGRIFLDICSGATRPLSAAALALGCDVLSFDSLLDQSMDLLRDDSYEQLLRICSSGQVGYGSASPACCHYSRLKLRPGPGPKALRTPEALQGVPGLNSHDLQKVQESYLMLSRCVICLTLIFQAGGHVHLEQPPSAMSWLEDCVKQFLKLISAWCIVIAACAYGKDWYKTWMFASSFSELSALGAVCQHPPDSHLPIRGLDPISGEFVSRQTACYPEALANMFAKLVAPLLSHNNHDWSWGHRHSLLPIKGRYAAPISYEDGAGIGSRPDWSLPERSEPDTFQDLRRIWVQRILHLKLNKQLMAYFSQSEHPAPPFEADTVNIFRRMLIQFFEQHNVHLDWGVREHQPMHLLVFQAFSELMNGPDQTLFPSLIKGVATGFLHNIPPSTCMPKNDREADVDVPLSAHYSNWHSADTAQSLVQEEIDKGWVFQFDGTLEDAQARWPAGVSVGKLGIAHSDGRAPRLVLDNTICGLNPRCWVPERSTLPTCKDILRTFPLRGVSGRSFGFFSGREGGT